MQEVHKIIFPSDAVSVFDSVCTLHDVHTMKKLSNDTFLRVCPHYKVIHK